MRRLERTSPLMLVALAALGVAVGLVLQMMLSARGQAPFVPPVSLSATLAVIAGVLIVLGNMLRRAVTRAAARPVNPFHAVRLLAGARAGQFAGALFTGFGVGLLLQIVTRTVPPPAETWLPMLFVGIAGLVLVVCGIITEALCRVPPGGDADAGRETDEHPGPAPDELPA